MLSRAEEYLVRTFHPWQCWYQTVEVLKLDWLWLAPQALRWHRRRALPGSEVRAPGARAGGPEPIPKGRTPPGWHWRLGTSLACSQDVHPQKPEAPTPAPAQGTRFPSVSTGGRNKAKSKGVVFSWKVRFHPCSQKAPKDKGTQEFSYLLGAEERRALTTKRERHKRASQ